MGDLQTFIGEGICLNKWGFGACTNGYLFYGKTFFFPIKIFCSLLKTCSTWTDLQLVGHGQ